MWKSSPSVSLLILLLTPPPLPSDLKDGCGWQVVMELTVIFLSEDLECDLLSLEKILSLALKHFDRTE